MVVPIRTRWVPYSLPTTYPLQQLQQELPQLLLVQQALCWKDDDVVCVCVCNGVGSWGAQTAEGDVLAG